MTEVGPVRGRGRDHRRLPVARPRRRGLAGPGGAAARGGRDDPGAPGGRGRVRSPRRSSTRVGTTASGCTCRCPSRTRTSQAECAFAVVERGLTAEGRPDEFGLPTAPSRRFVSAGGLTVVHDGVCEYELIDIGPGRRRHGIHPGADCAPLDRHVVPVRHGVPTVPGRPADAGRGVADDRSLRVAALCLGRRCRGPVCPGRRCAPAAGGGLGPGGWHPPCHGEHTGGGRCRGQCRRSQRRCARGPGLQPGPRPATVNVAGRSGWLVDLRGDPQSAFEESFELRPFGLATVRLNDD